MHSLKSYLYRKSFPQASHVSERRFSFWICLRFRLFFLNITAAGLEDRVDEKVANKQFSLDFFSCPIENIGTII
jgi:hypothetical protein